MGLNYFYMMNYKIMIPKIILGVGFIAAIVLLFFHVKFWPEVVFTTSVAGWAIGEVIQFLRHIRFRS